MRKTKATGYWTFLCNPAKWQIDKFLATNREHDFYQVTDWQINDFNPGQLGVIRVGTDSRNREQLNGAGRLKPGIYAIVETLGTPYLRGKGQDEFWLKWTDEQLKRSVVDIRILKNLLNSPLLLNDLKYDDLINDKYLIDGFQAASMPLQKESFERILNLIADETQVLGNLEREPFATLKQINDLEGKYKFATPEVKEFLSKRIERGKIAEEIKKITYFKCLICDALGLNPYSFKKKNGEYYIEAHHVIPVAEMTRGVLGLSNIITLCANHHRQLHYGDVETTVGESNFTFKLDCNIIEIDKVRIA